MTDLITNSSTVIYTYSDASEGTLRCMIDEVFRIFNINKTCDDVFNLSVTLEQEYNYTEYLKNCDEIPEELTGLSDKKFKEAIEKTIQDVKNGLIKKPEWMAKAENARDNDYGYGYSTNLNITPKAPEYERLATLVDKFLYSPSHEAAYNG